MTETNRAQPTHTFKRGRHGDAFCMVKYAGFICGQAADAPVHAVPAAPPVAPEATTRRDVLRDLHSLRNRALTSTGWLHRTEQLRLLDSIETWVRAQP